VSRTLTWDVWIFVAAICLTAFGVIMVGSASSFVALGHTRQPSHFLLRQFCFAAAGLALMMLVMRMRHRVLANRGVVLTLVVGAVTLLLAALMVPTHHNVNRWIFLGPVSIQPSEAAKIVLVIFLAYMIERKGPALNDWRTGLTPILAVSGFLVSLVLIQPDYGTAVLMVLVTGIMLFVAGIRWRYLLAAGGAAAIVLAGFLCLARYRLDRLFAFVDVWRHGTQANGEHSYQLLQSLVAVGSGGLTGRSLGQGHQKAHFLPEPYSDFIYAVIGEELGLLGCGLVLVAFLLLLWRGLLAAGRADDRFGSFLALGLTVLLVGQAMVNMGVVLGLLPTKGLALPLISYGGSSLLCSLTALGLLLAVARRPAR
jgi:cell division protein FtsW